MNMGHEEDELKPYSEPEVDLSDLKRIEILAGMGYNRSEIEDSLKTQKYDDVFATYLLLGRRSTDVSFTNIFFRFLQESFHLFFLFLAGERWISVRELFVTPRCSSTDRVCSGVRTDFSGPFVGSLVTGVNWIHDGLNQCVGTAECPPIHFGYLVQTWWTSGVIRW